LEHGVDDRASYMEGGMNIGVFRPISRFIPKTIQNTAIVKMDDK